MSGPAGKPTRRQVRPLGDQLVFERTVAWDEGRGVHILHGQRRARQPTSEQIAVHKRLQQLRDRLDAGDPEPLVDWIRETWIQRLVRIRNRLAARADSARAPASLNGLSS